MVSPGEKTQDIDSVVVALRAKEGGAVHVVGIPATSETTSISCWASTWDFGFLISVISQVTLNFKFT